MPIESSETKLRPLDHNYIENSRKKSKEALSEVDTYLYALEDQMKDIRGENDELKKMLKEMYKVHLSTLGTRNSTSAVQNHVYEDSGRD